MKNSKDVRIIRLECGKANAIDERFLKTLDNALTEAESSGARAVVLTGYENYFSAGLNLRELPEDGPGMLRFVESFESRLLRLATYPRPIVAAVNGHAVAGGCVLAAACDRRLGAESKYQVGLSELDLGVPFPPLALAVIRRVLKEPWLTDMVLGARILSPAEAVEAGVLHRLVRPEQLLDEAADEASRLGEKPQPAFRITKAAIRGQLADVERGAGEVRQQFVECWFSDEARRRRQAMLQR